MVFNIQASKWNTQDEVEFCFNRGIHIQELFGTAELALQLGLRV